uniref:YTH domain-containing protein ECT4-like n=1 Tax=Erigeron canadensis TaxID=72917 RepID=UPI001CB88EA2|nr:YTH domain-containing protein ECT4-like [Erigeron canadensis]
MATVAPTADQATDLMKNLTLDSQSKTLEVSEPAKKPSVGSGDIGNGQSQPLDRSLTPLIPDYMDPTVAYYHNGYASPAYYYGGYDGATSDWDDYSRYLNTEGVDLSHGVYGDNGSVMYPNYGYAPPYGPYSPAASPVPTAGHDGQLFGAQHYQYPSPYFPQMTQTVPPKGDISRSAASGQPPLTVGTAGGIPNSTMKANPGSVSVRPATYQNSAYNGSGSYGRGSQNSYQDPRYAFDGVRSPVSWLDASMYSSGLPRNTTNTTPLSNATGFASKNQNIHPNTHLVGPRPVSGMNAASGYMNRMYPNKVYGQYQSAYGSGLGFGSNTYGSQNNGHGWLSVNSKYKPRGRGNGFFGSSNENADGLNELNRGPRTRVTKAQSVPTSVTIAVKEPNGDSSNIDGVEKEKVCAVPDKEQYNQTEFPDTYADAKFFIIKSYSEDDVHKSIKYNVWSSTQNGNKKLDAAYQEAQQKSGQCPIFLFFSVNTSGQFVGVAEMVGPVDFDKSVEYWQQDKWIGCFPVKWHIVKDVPNSLLKHITLEYNENKPVTNSRDTQEVKLEQGLQVIKIFKEHSSKQCILDDFEFYEEREKRIQEKKAKQQLFQKQAWEEKPAIVEKNREEVAPELVKEEIKVTDNGPVIVNGVANGC